MLNKNDVLTGTVTAVANEGEGIIKVDDVTVFVPFAMLGETLTYKILKVKKNIAYGKVVEILTPSKDRVIPPCPYFYKCGGCAYQHIDYQTGLEIKQNLVKNCLSKIGGIDAEVDKTYPSPEIFGYRNKLQIPVSNVNGKTVIGFYAENSHRVVEAKECIMSGWSGKLISAFTAYVEKFNISGYDEETGFGVLRHIVCREVDNQFMITAVVTTENPKGVEYLIEKLKENFEVFTLYLNVNKKKTNVILGDKFILRYGSPRYLSTALGVKYEFGASNFLQVNRKVSETIYERAVALASPESDSIVIDAYSGAGLMTACLAKKAKKAIGVEIIKEAVECADSLKKLNGLDDKMENICGACEEILPPLIKQLRANGEKITVVLDPPRKGCDKKVLDVIKDADIDRVVYISCNPSTLARDLGLLTGALIETADGLKKTGNLVNYEVEKVEPYDMFPHTKHVETLVVLQRKKV